jgi:hypothetical protein
MTPEGYAGILDLKKEQKPKKMQTRNKSVNFFILLERCNNSTFFSLSSIFTENLKTDIIQKREDDD